MALLQFDEVIRNDLTNIQMDTQIACTFHMHLDTNTVDRIGMPTPKATEDITTTVIFSPVRHDEEWLGAGIDEKADAKIIVHELVDENGLDLIEAEWFVRDNYRNVTLTISNRNYRILAKRGHVELRDKSPYHVLWLQRLMD